MSVRLEHWDAHPIAKLDYESTRSYVSSPRRLEIKKLRNLVLEAGEERTKLTVEAEKVYMIIAKEDGLLDKEELVAAHSGDYRIFDLLDADGNGVVTVDEWHDYIEGLKVSKGIRGEEYVSAFLDGIIRGFMNNAKKEGDITSLKKAQAMQSSDSTLARPPLFCLFNGAIAMHRNGHYAYSHRVHPLKTSQVLVKIWLTNVRISLGGGNPDCLPPSAHEGYETLPSRASLTWEGADMVAPWPLKTQAAIQNTSDGWAYSFEEPLIVPMTLYLDLNRQVEEDERREKAKYSGERADSKLGRRSDSKLGAGAPEAGSLAIGRNFLPKFVVLNLKNQSEDIFLSHTLEISKYLNTEKHSDHFSFDFEQNSTLDPNDTGEEEGHIKLELVSEPSKIESIVDDLEISVHEEMPSSIERKEVSILVQGIQIHGLASSLRDVRVLFEIIPVTCFGTTSHSLSSTEGTRLIADVPGDEMLNGITCVTESVRAVCHLYKALRVTVMAKRAFTSRRLPDPNPNHNHNHNHNPNCTLDEQEPSSRPWERAVDPSGCLPGQSMGGALH